MRVLESTALNTFPFVVHSNLEIVVVWVVGHAPVEERPRQVINRILFVLNGFRNNFRIKMVMQAVIQMGFHGQRLIQELFK